MLREAGQVVATVALLVGGFVAGWWGMFSLLKSDLGGVALGGLLVVLGACCWFGRRRWVTFVPALGALLGAAGALVLLLLVLAYLTQGS